MTQKSTHLKFRQAFTFPEVLEKRMWDIMLRETQRLGRPTIWLHAPSGISRLGKVEPYINPNIKVVNLDIDPSVEPDIITNIFAEDYKVPDSKGMSGHPMIISVIEKGGFDGAITDPIWYEQKRTRCEHCGKMTTFKNKKGLAYPQRRYLSYELRDCIREGGLIIFNGLWNPLVKNTYAEFLEIHEDHETNMNKVEAPDIDRPYVEVPDQSFTSFRNLSLVWYIRKRTDISK